MSADNWTICPKCGDLGDPTFREDWDIGVQEDGEFHVEYTGRCVTCKLSFKYIHQSSLPDNRTKQVCTCRHDSGMSTNCSVHYPETSK